MSVEYARTAVETDVDESQCNALHDAAENNNFGAVDVLLSRGWNPNARNKLGCTPLHIACVCASEKVVQRLVAAGGNINEKCNLGRTPLYMAVARNNFVGVNITRNLIKADADLYCYNNNGHLPIHVASYFGNKDMVQLFLDKGMSIDVMTQDDTMVCLHFAIKSENPEMLKFLLDKGASVKIGREKLTETICPPMTPLKYCLDKYFEDENPKGSMCRLLLNAGADVNTRCYMHSTVAAFAAYYPEHINLLQLCLDKKAHIDKRNTLGETPYANACWGGNIAAMELLKKHNTPLDNGDIDEDTVSDTFYYHSGLGAACRAGKPESVRLALKHGARTDGLYGLHAMLNVLEVEDENARAECISALHEAGVRIDESTLEPYKNERASSDEE